MSGRVLRDGQTGAIIKAPAGYVLTSQSDGTWAGEAPGGGGSVAPLSCVLYVDGGGTQPGTPDGSIGKPFLTLTDGLAAAQVLLDAAVPVALIVTPGDYTAEGAGPTVDVSAASLAIIAASGDTWLEPDNSRPDTVGVLLDTITCTGTEGYLQLQGVKTVNGIDYSNGGLLLQHCLNGSVAFHAGSMRAEECFFGLVELTGAPAEATFTRCAFNRSGAVGLSIGSDATVPYFSDCTFRPDPTIECTGEDPATLSFDESTYANFVAANGVLVNCVVVVRSSAPALANWVFNPPTDFPAGVITQVDCVPLTTAPVGEGDAGAVGGWFGNAPDDALIVIGCQVDSLGTGMRVFVLNYTGAAVNGVSNVLFTVSYPRAST